LLAQLLSLQQHLPAQLLGSPSAPTSVVNGTTKSKDLTQSTTTSGVAIKPPLAASARALTASAGTLKWHTKWSWAGGAGHVKSYANVVTKVTQKAISSISSLSSTWTWNYTGSNIIANVAYDIFTGASATGSAQYEVMIWLSALGGAGPISSTGSAIATVTVAGKQFKLYKGPNGQMTVFSFVAVSPINSFNGDLNAFLVYLRSSQGLPASQILQSVGAGTEPFSGSNAVLTTTAFTLSQK